MTATSCAFMSYIRLPSPLRQARRGFASIFPRGLLLFPGVSALAADSAPHLRGIKSAIFQIVYTWVL